MTLTRKIYIAALILAFTLAPALHAADARLLAYYEFSDKFNVPPYDSSTIPYHELTHIVHSNIAPSWKLDGSLMIPSGFLEPTLIARAHAAGVKVELCVSGNAGQFVYIDADPGLRATFAQNIANFAIANGYDGWTSITKSPTTISRPSSSPRSSRICAISCPPGKLIWALLFTVMPSTYTACGRSAPTIISAAMEALPPSSTRRSSRFLKPGTGSRISTTSPPRPICGMRMDRSSASSPMTILRQRPPRSTM